MDPTNAKPKVDSAQLLGSASHSESAAGASKHQSTPPGNDSTYLVKISDLGNLGRKLKWRGEKAYVTVVNVGTQKQFVLTRQPPIVPPHGTMKVRANRRPKTVIRRHFKITRAEDSSGLDFTYFGPNKPSEQRTTDSGAPAQRKEELLARIRAASESAKQKFLNTGLMISATELHKALGISRQAVSQAREAGRFFVVAMPNGAEYYPSFFLSQSRKAIEGLSKRLSSLDGWSKWAFFTTPKDSLQGLTPIEALEAGKVADVERAADGYLSA